MPKPKHMLYHVVLNHRYIGVPHELSICTSRSVDISRVGNWRTQKEVLRVPTKAVRRAMRTVKRLSKMVSSAVVELKFAGPYWLWFVKYRDNQTQVILQCGPDGMNAWNITKEVKEALGR